MDKSGLDIQVIHNSFFFAYPTSWGAGDPKLGSAICASYNSWIAEKCAQSGGRLSFSAVVCLDDLEGAIAEVKRAKGLGASSIYVNGTIGEKKLARAENDRFFQALCDNDIPLTVHIGWCFPALTDLMDTPYEARVVSLILPLLVGFSDVISADILTRFDTLRVGFLEGGCDWIPFMVDQLENIYQVFTKRLNWAPRQLSNSPLEIIRTNPRLFFGTEPESHLLPDVIKEIGNKFVCGSDMPHTETTDTRSKHMVILDRDDLSDVDKRKIVDTNPKAFFRVSAWEKMQPRALSQAAE
jgi:predicted TIM-barrel fold metal-dependent hydrolase